MRRTLKLLLLLGIGLMMAKDKGGDGITPGGTDNTIDPATGKPKSDAERKEDMTYKGQDAGTDFKGVKEAAEKEAQDGRNEGQGSTSQDGDSSNDSDSPAEDPKVKPTGNLENDFDALPQGNSRHVKTVESEAELREFFDSWTEGATQVPGSPPKIPERFKLPDGTMVQWRTSSASGGATIDIVTPGSGMRKVHLE
jgi:hypothetical protein